jgi:hypothetical protein
MDGGSSGLIWKKFLLLVGPEPAMVMLVRRPLLEGIAEVTSHFLLLTPGETERTQMSPRGGVNRRYQILRMA